MKKINLLLSVVLASVLFLTACQKDSNLSQSQESSSVTSSTAQTNLSFGTRLELETQKEISEYVALRIKNGGDILIKLDAEAAPLTVQNFQKLVEKSFYNGLIFHRIVPGFVIQGGDPLGTGTGGSEETIQGEFLENGYYNPLNHTRGVLSMARTSDPNSASSQFFIVLDNEARNSLNGRYASFGYVLSGMDVVDAIASVERDASDKPLVDVIIEEAVFVTPASAQKYLK